MVTPAQNILGLLSSPSLYGGLGSMLGGYAGRGTKTSPLLSALGGLIGGQAGSLFAGKGLDFNQASSQAMLGNLGGSLGAMLGGADNRWASPVGRVAGTLLSPILRGDNIISSLGTPGSMQGIGGALGGAFGGRTGGALGTVGGNILGNVVRGMQAGQSAGNIAGSIGSVGNLANLGTSLIPFLLPKDMPPQASAIISNMLPMVAGALGAPVATIGSTLGSSLASSLGLSSVLSSTPIGAIALPIAMVYNVIQGVRAQNKIRKKDEKGTYLFNKSLEEAAPKFKPLYDTILDIGKKRMTDINATINPDDPTRTRDSVLNKLGIVDKTYGFTEPEMAALFGTLEPGQGYWGDWYTAPAAWARSSYSKHQGQAPYTTAQMALMMREGVNFDKIVPWLNTNTQMLKNYDKYQTDPATKAAIDNALEYYNPMGTDALSKLVENMRWSRADEARRESEAAFWQSFHGAA